MPALPRLRLRLLLFTTLACAPTPSDPPTPYFVDQAPDAGLDFTHSGGGAGDYFLIETMGSGGAFLDYDLDGWLDIYLVDGFDLSHLREQYPPANLSYRDETHYWVEKEYQQGLRLIGTIDSSAYQIAPSANDPAKRNRLFRNQGDGTYKEVTDAAGAGDTGYGMGVAVGDYDRDGDPDLYVTNYGPNALYRNDAGTFSNITATTGVGDPRWSTSALFFDYDHDGDLDLYTANYLDFYPANNRICGGTITPKRRRKELLKIPFDRRTYCSPRRYNGVPDVLYRNDGRAFSDVTEATGLLNRFGKGLGVLAADYDHDGDMDLYIANDGVRNAFYRNDQGRFTDIALTAGAAYNDNGEAEASMGIAAGDYDRDGDPDLFVTNFSRESNTLYRNDGANRYTDSGALVGLEEPSMRPLGFATLFFDADNDCDLDLFVANGHVMDRIRLLEEDLRYAQSDQLFTNTGTGQFQDRSATTGPAFAREAVSRGAAYGDYDRDGDLDLLVTHSNGPVALYRNDLPPDHHWLALTGQLTGAIITLRCADQTQTRTIAAGGSYLSANSPQFHFGLGSCDETASLTIRWPDGTRTDHRNLQTNQIIRIVRER